MAIASITILALYIATFLSYCGLAALARRRRRALTQVSPEMMHRADVAFLRSWGTQHRASVFVREEVPADQLTLTDYSLRHIRFSAHLVFEEANQLLNGCRLLLLCFLLAREGSWLDGRKRVWLIVQPYSLLRAIFQLVYYRVFRRYFLPGKLIAELRNSLPQDSDLYPRTVSKCCNTKAASIMECLFPPPTTPADSRQLAALLPAGYIPGRTLSDGDLVDEHDHEHNVSVIDREMDLLVRQGALPAECKAEVGKAAKRLLALAEDLPVVSNQDCLLDHITPSHTCNLVSAAVMFAFAKYNHPLTAARDPYEASRLAANQVALQLVSQPGLFDSHATDPSLNIRLILWSVLLKESTGLPEQPPARADLAYELLYQASNTDLIIDASEAFEHAYARPGVSQRLVVILDDAGEGVLVLAWIQRLLRMNSSLHITAIPRGRPVLDDITYHEVYSLIRRESAFDFLRTSIQNGRFSVVADGPTSSGLNLLRLSNECATAISQADAIVAVGQSAIETLNGVQKALWMLSVVTHSPFAAITGIPGRRFFPGRNRKAFFAYLPPGTVFFEGYTDKIIRRLQVCGIALPVARTTMVETVIRQSHPFNRIASCLEPLGASKQAKR